LGFQARKKIKRRGHRRGIRWPLDKSSARVFIQFKYKYAKTNRGMLTEAVLRSVRNSRREHVWAFKHARKLREGGTGEEFAGLSTRAVRVYLSSSNKYKYAKMNRGMWEGETGSRTDKGIVSKPATWRRERVGRRCDCAKVSQLQKVGLNEVSEDRNGEIKHETHRGPGDIH
jgi:hypothetical protein